MTNVVVLSDTHICIGGRRRLPDAAYRHLGAADVILHAGDILVAEVLEELADFAPVHAVLGNNDVSLLGLLPETRTLEIDGVRIGMVHDSGSAAGRSARLRRRFPDSDVVVFGHSHIPWDQPGQDGQLLFNPGSPTDRRAQPHHTVGTLELDAGRVVAHTLHVV